MGKLRFIQFLLFCITVTGLITGCVQTNLQVEPVVQTAQIPTALTHTLENSPIPSTTTADALIKTITPSPTVKPTSRPTLSPEDAHQLLLDLFENNGGCRFPCWFGLTPGHSTYSETKEFVETFSTMTAYRNTSSYQEYLFEFRSPPSEENDGRLWGKLHGENPDLLTYVWYEAPLSNFPLNNILSQYGPPDEIRLSALGYYMGLSNLGTFWIVLYYKEQGILVEYEGNMEKAKVLDICFPYEKLRPYVRILLWDPDKNYSFKEAGNLMKLQIKPENSIDEDYRPINELSDLDVPSFYERYRVAENRGICFGVPDRDWPVDP